MAFPERQDEDGEDSDPEEDCHGRSLAYRPG